MTSNRFSLARLSISSDPLGLLPGTAARTAPRLVLWSRAIANEGWWITFTTFLTFWALAGDDLKFIVCEAPADIYFNCIVLVCLVIFFVEILFSCLGRDDYFLSFFFLLDIVSTTTLLLDLSWVSDVILNAMGADNARTSKAARLGAKMGRLVRVIRLVRILKLYNAVVQGRKSMKTASPGEEELDEEWADADIEKGKRQSNKESRVGRKLSEITTRRVIILVLVMLVVMPFLQSEDFSKEPLSAHYGANLVWEHLWSGSAEFEAEMLRYLYYHNWFARRGYCGNHECAEVYLSHVFWFGIQGSDALTVERASQNMAISMDAVDAWVENTSEQNFVYNYGYMPRWAQLEIAKNWTQQCHSDGVFRLGRSLLSQAAFPVICPTDLRLLEYAMYWPLDMPVEADPILVFFFDLRPFRKQEAGYSLATTGFVCVVLCSASLSFAQDANRLVLRPVENMIKRVEAIRDEPLVALKMADEVFRAEEFSKARQRRRRKENLKRVAVETFANTLGKTQEPMETLILENTIIKLGSLLALGFGEAGANIIGHNMRGADSAGVNVMVPGTRVESILGVARIRDFSVATEVLQAKIMTFVNQIAEIVHGVVNEYCGATNKNNGEMFLIVWRVDPSEKPAARTAEMSIVAFAKVVAAVHRSSTLATYRYHPGLQQRLGKGCRVSVSFGLHSGWAIEGAVGSEFKIDASYLSPNVTLAMSVERATLTYDVPILAAESVVSGCTRGIASKCRRIDNVLITGCTSPMHLFSVDLDVMAATVDERLPKIKWSTRERFKARQFLEAEKLRNLDLGLDMAVVFEQDPTISAMRRRYTTDFVERYNMGFQNYVEGEWSVAGRMLQQVLEYFEDGPALELLRFMKVPFHFTAPPTWTGTRELQTSSDDFVTL